MVAAHKSTGRLELDTSSFPLVLLRFPRTLDADALAALKRAQRQIYGFERRYVSIADMRGSDLMPPATIRREASEWAKQEESGFKRWQLASTIIVDSALVRAGIQAVHWFAPPPVPTMVVTSYAEAATFLRAQAERAGMPLGLRANARLEALSV